MSVLQFSVLFRYNAWEEMFEPTGEFSMMGSLWGTAKEMFAYERCSTGCKQANIEQD